MKISQVMNDQVSLQDGTGTELEDKLVATTLEHVEMGVLVVAKGVIKTDVDIGAGYQYRVLLEDVTFSENEK